MSRYGNTNIKNNIIKRGMKNKRNYKVQSNDTTLYDSIPESERDIHLITQEGDRLDLLANEYYKDPRLWWYIAKANNLKFITVERGTKIRIPYQTNNARGT